MSDHSNQDYCADLVRRFDRGRWLAAAVAPAPTRRRLLTLYALNVEVTRIAEIASEPMVGLIRLQWWRDIMEELDAGEVREQPVLQELAPLFGEGALSAADFLEMLDMRAGDFEDGAPADIAEVEAFCRVTGGSLCRLAVRLCGVGEGTARLAAEEIGTAHALAGRLRNVPWWASRGKVILPGVTGDQGRTVRHITERAQTLLREARQKHTAVPAQALPALLIARLAAQHLRRIERLGFDLHAPGLEPLPLAAPLAILRGALSGRY